MDIGDWIKVENVADIGDWMEVDKGINIGDWMNADLLDNGEWMDEIN
jgi:hypothetical protein